LLGAAAISLSCKLFSFLFLFVFSGRGVSNQALYFLFFLLLFHLFIFSPFLPFISAVSNSHQVFWQDYQRTNKAASIP